MLDFVRADHALPVAVRGAALRLSSDTIVDGREIAIPHTLGSPEVQLSPAQVAAKLALVCDLAPDADPWLFDDPLGYFTQPQQGSGPA